MAVFMPFSLLEGSVKKFTGQQWAALNQNKVAVWQGKIKRRARVFLAFRPDAAAVAVYDARDSGQAYTAAFKLVDMMQALEGTE